ncbi:ACT domain-containing protein [uncultured Desulfovibrio sp.]|uniref:ACT domain-containing protein n=1 Tax=uncultured Desulfovibrio sp. TaxID=167968 RepID=UPI002601FE21|nr:ACT domain-containing protein [uncultured Desulfovibrio sp.]
MKAEQLSVFLENRAGRLAEVTHTLAEAGINIRALSLADTSDFGILRMIVCDHEKAKSVLKEKGFTLGRTSVVAVDVADTPGGLDAVLQLVSRNGINVEYMYAFVQRDQESAAMIFRFDKVDQAVDVLKNNGFNIIPAERLCAY